LQIIEKLVLKNFKKFRELELDFNSGINILIGDNETGKSTVLLALDLLLGASRSRVESLGIENLLCKQVVDSFLAGQKKIELLPILVVEAWLSHGGHHELNGNVNSKGVRSDGLRLEIFPIDDYGQDICDVLAEDHPNFPYEYYGIKFQTFSEASITSYRKPLTHITIDSSKIDQDYAVREYTKSVFKLHTQSSQRHKLENKYRKSKESFKENHLDFLNDKLSSYKFGVRSSTRANLGTDIVITEDDIPLESRGKGRQCFLKTDLALQRRSSSTPLNVLLLEEPENHLSHTNMKKLVKNISNALDTQMFIATHSSHISSRLDLRKAQLLGINRTSSLKLLSEDTANFFIKAPDNNILEFALSNKVILVEGDAEFILLDAFYRKIHNISIENDNVHVISIGGKSFKRYLELGKLLNLKVAAITDNDGDFQKKCLENYSDFLYETGKIFYEENNSLYTFEKSIYALNKKICDEAFGSGRRTLNSEDYMLRNKAEVALKLLEDYEDQLIVPDYIIEALQWIKE
jgi:putative ATP-dependent endonuclease of OLD family